METLPKAGSGDDRFDLARFMAAQEPVYSDLFSN